MLSTDIPAKFPIPWANGAGSAYVRPIPVASQINIQPGAASLTDGFPPLNTIPVQAGGIPPFGQDFNGIFQQVTAWIRWISAGGPATFDGTFVAATGGYPRGALLLSTTGHAVYESLADNNTGNPNSGAANWRLISCVWSSGAWTASGSANIQTITLSPAPTSMAQLLGIPIIVSSQGINTGAVTLNVNGMGAIAVNTPSGVALAPGALSTNSYYEVAYNGSFFVLLSSLSTFVDGGTAGVRVFGATGTGAGILLTNTGGTPGSKTLRCLNNQFDVVNAAYSLALLSVTDLGDVSVARNFSAVGSASVGSLATSVGSITSQANVSANVNIIAGQNVTATTGNVTAGGFLIGGAGAYGTGNNSIATLLGDFTRVDGNHGYFRLPNGKVVVQGFATGPTVANGAGSEAFGITLNALDSLVICPANNNAVTTSAWTLQTAINGFTFSCNQANVNSYYIGVGS